MFTTFPVYASYQDALVRWVPLLKGSRYGNVSPHVSSDMVSRGRYWGFLTPFGLLPLLLSFLSSQIEHSHTFRGSCFLFLKPEMSFYNTTLPLFCAHHWSFRWSGQACVHPKICYVPRSLTTLSHLNTALPIFSSSFSLPLHSSHTLASPGLQSHSGHAPYSSFHMELAPDTSSADCCSSYIKGSLLVTRWLRYLGIYGYFPSFPLPLSLHLFLI